MKIPQKKSQRQALKRHNSPRNGEKYKGAVLHVNQNSDQEETEVNLNQHKTKGKLYFPTSALCSMFLCIQIWNSH